MIVVTTLVVLLAACSAPSTERSPAMDTSPRSTDAPTNVPAIIPATQAPTTQPPNNPTTEPPNHPTTQPPTNAPTTQTNSDAAIPSGATAEGYFYLGNPDAKVTLIDYSDFL